MLKKAVLFILLLLKAVNPVCAQNEICGKVTDGENGGFLTGVYITAYGQNTLLGYAISGEEGIFRINTRGKEVTHLLFYRMGYKQQKAEITGMPEQGEIMHIQMEPAAEELRSIVVKPAAIIIKGDTTQYNADSFKRNEDRNIGEVIARLPGVQVSVGGQIKVQGEVINKFYIEDMDLLGGRYGMAVRNLRPDDIAYIQVYNNHQPVRALSGIEVTNRAAMNIKLTQKAKRRWLLSFGAAAGSGFPGFLYSAKTGAMRFAGRGQTFIIAKSDNAGNNIIRETAVQNMGPGHFNMEKLENGMSDLFNVSTRRLPVPEEYYYFNNSQAASVNQLNKLSPCSEIKANILFTANELKDSYMQKKIITTSDGAQIMIADSNNTKRRDIRLSGEITFTSNKEKLYLQNILSFKILKDRARSFVSANNSVYDQEYQLPKFRIENKFSFIKGKGGKVYKFYNTTRFSSLDQEFNVISDSLRPLFGSTGVNQSMLLRDFSNQSYFSFVKRINKVSFSIEPGVELLYNTLNTQLTPAVSANGAEIGAANELSLFSARPYLNTVMTYNGRKMKLNLSVPLMLRRDHLNRIWSSFFIYSPLFRMDYSVSPVVSIIAQASLSNDIGEIQSMTPGYIYASYRNFYSNGTLSEKINRYYTLKLDYQSIENFFTTNLSTAYSVDQYNITPSDLYLGNYIFTSVLERNRHNRRLNINARAQKSFGLNIFTIGADVQYGFTRTSQYLQNRLYEYKITNYGVTFQMRYSPDGFLSAGYVINFTKNSFDASDKNHIDYLSNKLDVVCFPVSRLELKGVFTHILQKRENYEDISLPFLDFHAAYKIGRRLSLTGSLKNALNIKEYKSMYYSGIASNSNKIKLRGLELTAGIMLDF